MGVNDEINILTVHDVDTGVLNIREKAFPMRLRGDAA
tara:strand:+ start:693 stop:803 length:111 start_codon:yes stop_codon:yes gene_type:complete